MINNTKKILTEDAVAHTIHFINKTVRAANNQLQAKDCKTDFYVMTGNLVEQVIDSIECRNAKSALVIGDAGLQIVNRLIQEGITDITLALSRFENKECGTHGYLLDSVSYIIKSTFPNIKINIIDSKETAGMKTDLMIANYPYGAIGANLTKKAIDTVDFKEFINLLPANDYKRNTTKDLFNYQSDMIIVNNGFEDADVTTSIAKIHKTKVNNMTLDQFEVSQYDNKKLTRYFNINLNRNSNMLDNYDSTGARLDSWSPETVFVNSTRTTSDGHFARTKSSPEYRWNVNNEFSDLKTKGYDKLVNKQGRHKTSFVGLFLPNKEVKTNIAKFIYSTDGYLFMCMILSAMKKDSWCAYKYWFPKVDWTRPWTVEEILTDYGYTADEIAEVMTDLANFKGMED